MALKLRRYVFFFQQTLGLGFSDHAQRKKLRGKQEKSCRLRANQLTFEVGGGGGGRICLVQFQLKDSALPTPPPPSKIKCH